MSFFFSLTNRTALMLALTLLTLPARGAGEIHRWTDSAGNVHFGDRPPAATNAEIVKLRINTYASPDIQGLEEISGTGNRVVMYSATWCGVCRQAKRYFEAEQIPYTEYDVETSAKGRRDYRQLGARGVPVILVGRQRLNGFSPARFERLYRESAAPR